MAAFNILVVDDAAFIRDLVKKAVRETYPGSSLHEAIDGRKAISILGSHDIHLVLCDWEMPEISGIEVLQWMRADERYKNTPFMMITSRGDRDHVVKAVQEGVSEYIGKPFTRENFVAKLSKLVWKHLKIRPQAADTPVNPRAASAADAFGAANITKPKGGDFGGAGVLMGAAKPTAAPVKQDMGGAGILMAATAEPTSSKPGIRAKGIADVRFASGGQAKLVIKDINLQELIGVFRRDGVLPQLLEQAVLDIVDKESGAVARINGYVRMLQAQEPSPDAQTIQMTLRYVDDDPEKLETLSLYIAKVR
ncbi:MAG: hypothetical protein RL217_241 [Pseudomonadota bacterium]|jgi:CheY-like chemotaxis protein